ncbi:putative reverse transcriptase domain-containing protein [Tanacetum coccineum]
MSESAKRHEENSNLIKEIRASTNAAIRNQGASIKNLEIQIGQMSKVLQERGFGSLPSSTETNPRDHVKSISTIVEAYSTVKYPKGIAKNVLVGIGKFVFPVDFIILDMPEDIKVPLILGRPFFSTARAKIGVFKRKITLRVGEEKIIFKSVKPASSLIKRVYILGLRERMELDLEARIIGETLVLNRSLDPSFGDYIELNDHNVPLEIRRDQVDDLMPTIEEGEVVEEFRARNDAKMVSKVFGYPSDCDHDKKIHIDCAYNLKFSCMLDFVVLEDMDAYCNEGMGDVIFGEPFLREVKINAIRFEGIITIYNCNEEVTYQMVRSHSRFKHHTNEQCNKIPPLLKNESFCKTTSKEGKVKLGWLWLAMREGSSIGFCLLGFLGPMERLDVFRAPIHRIRQGRYGVSVTALTKDHEGNKIQYACMKRSSTKELFTPFKDPKQEFRSSRKHFNTLSLDESRSPDIDLFSDQEEYSEEEVTETMAETMEQYMSKTRADYGLGVVRPKIEDKDNFKLKGQFFKELRTNTFSNSDHEDANEHIEKVLEIVDLFHIPNITIDQVMLRAFRMSLTGAASRWLRNKPSGSITTCEDLKTKYLSKYCPPARTAKKMEEINNFQQEPDENLYQAWERFKGLLMKCPQHYLIEMQEVVLFYNGLVVPTKQILDSRGVIPSKTVVDAKVAIQEIDEYFQK